MTAGAARRRPDDRLARPWPRTLVLLLPALSALAAPVHGRAAEDPVDRPSIVRLDAVVTRLGGGERAVDRWSVYALRDGDRLWIKIEPRSGGAVGHGTCLFAAADGSRWRLGRCLPTEGTLQDAGLSSPLEVPGTGLDLRDLAAVVDLDRAPPGRTAGSAAEVAAFGEAGGKGPRGLRIRRPEGTERVVTFLSEGQRGGRTYVRKFQVTSAGSEGSTVVEFRDVQEVPIRPGALFRMEEFCGYRMKEGATTTNAE